MKNFDIERGPSGFPSIAQCAIPTLKRTYTRLKDSGLKERWPEVNDRTVRGISKIGKFTPEQEALLHKYQGQLYVTLAGRVLWVGGTPWSEKDENVIGLYNCSSLTPTDWGYFNLLMRQLGMGTGVGFVLFPENVERLPIIKRQYELEILGSPGELPSIETTQIVIKGDSVVIEIGDSLRGWANAFEGLLHLFSDTYFNWEHRLDGPLPPQLRKVIVDLRRVRKAGSPIKGFGGVTNPSYLPEFFNRVVYILNKAFGRKLTPQEVGHIQCIVASLIVAGNVRRCLPGDYTVIAKEGLIEISKIQVGTLVKTPSGYKPVLAVSNEGIQKVTYVSLDGSHFMATPNHRIGVQKKEGYEWKEVSQLKPGDFIEHAFKDERYTYEVLDIIPDYKEVEVWDIQVAEEECFYFNEGIISHNSALMIQYLFSDEAGATWKDNLWVQDEKGNWKIDPFRDPLRMANVTRVSLDKEELSLEAITKAVEMQYYSGEGAIQWGGAALLRANRDVLDNPAICESFIKALQEKRALQFLLDLGIPDREAQDRLIRLGLNPCVTGDTVIQTHKGPQMVRDLVGQQTKVLVNGQLYETTERGFFFNGVKPVVRVSTNTGREVKLTGNHKLKRATSNIEIADSLWNHWEEWVQVDELKVGDRVVCHNHEGKELLTEVVYNIEPIGEEPVYDCQVPEVSCYDANGFMAHNCGEITGHNFMCNLGQVHLELIDPKDFKAQREAFEAAALGVAALLNKGFVDPLLQDSREWDPIVAVTFTGLFDFFVNAFGPDWLRWWDAGRPQGWGKTINPANEFMVIDWGRGIPIGDYFREKEVYYLNFWREVVEQTVKEYCVSHNLKVPTRCTSLQPSGSKSLLTGGCSAFYPPKTPYYWRSITMSKNSPEAMACVEYGYQVMPAQSAKDEDGQIISDPYDPRVTEWLIRIPCRVSWADIIPPGLKVGTLEGAPIESQWDLFQTVDREYVRHTTSITLEFSKEDIPTLSKLIYEGIQDDSYVSAALLNRDYKCFPNMPFCPMTKEEYDQEMVRLVQTSQGKDLEDLIDQYQLKLNTLQEAPAPSCGGDLCEVKAR